jgi:tetratricopeptide (TPR) repeat protein
MKKPARLMLFFMLALSAALPLTAQTLQDGLKLYRTGQPQEAYDVFSKLLRESPKDEQINFALGMAAIDIGKLSHAQFAFQRVLMQNPEHHRARAELARTYFLMGQFEIAETEFDKVLATDPPPVVQANIEKFLAEIRKQTRKLHFKGIAGLSLFHDDNINFGPASNTIDLNGQNLTLNPGNQKTSTWGTGLSFSGEMLYDAGYSGDWFSLSGLSLYRSVHHNDDAYAQELTYLRLQSGARHLSRENIFEVLAKVEYLEYGHDELLTSAGGEVNWIHSLTADDLLITRGGLEYRDYKISNRDAPYAKLSQTWRHYIKNHNHFVYLTAGGFSESANKDWLAKDGGELTLGGETLLPEVEITLYSAFKTRRTRYRAEDAALGKTRRDDQWEWSAGLRKKLTPDWLVDCSYRRLDNESNSDLYDYNRDLFTFSTFIQF